MTRVCNNYVCCIFSFLNLQLLTSEAKPLSLAVKPLSSSGCACKSGCDKSWHGKDTEWCYVDKKCKASGWDPCGDTQKLYASVVNEKKQEEKKKNER